MAGWLARWITGIAHRSVRKFLAYSFLAEATFRFLGFGIAQVGKDTIFRYAFHFLDTTEKRSNMRT